MATTASPDIAVPAARLLRAAHHAHLTPSPAGPEPVGGAAMEVGPVVIGATSATGGGVTAIGETTDTGVAAGGTGVGVSALGRWCSAGGTGV